MGNVWAPVCKEVDGEMYGKVDKWDRPLTKLLTGSPMRLVNQAGKARNSMNVPFMDELMKLRTSACMEALRQALDTSDGSDTKRRRVTVLRPADEDLVGPAVPIKLPEALLDDGSVLNAVDTTVLFQSGKPRNLWICLQPPVIEYISERMKNELRAGLCRSVARDERQADDGAGDEGDM